MKSINEIILERIDKILKEEEKYPRPRPKEQIEKELIRKIERNVPARYINAEMQDEDLWNEIKNREKQGIYLFGTVGTGKTYILYAILKRMRAGGIYAKLWNIPDKLAHLRKSFQEDGGG